MRYANIYYKSVIRKFAADASTIKWARGIVDQAFRKQMGREPSLEEAHIVMAVSQLESGYGKGWGSGGAGSHNWGAVQIPKSQQATTKGFTYGDSSPQGKYVTQFRQYSSDVDGAADVVGNLFQSGMKQREPDPNNKQRAIGAPITEGPTRSQLIVNACKSGSILEFSKAMWFTIYFEGFGNVYKDRIASHANTISKCLNEISSATGESSKWTLNLNGDYLPTGASEVRLEKLKKLYPFAISGGSATAPSTETGTPATGMGTPQEMEQEIEKFINSV
jgi:hypothetical protein